MASMKALVPDLAIVPRLFTSSFFVMPIPESSMVTVELNLVRDDFDEVVRLGLDLLSDLSWTRGGSGRGHRTNSI